jgi:predicted house-cleaning noncanonical NTP pyrophosphatase (MazG superfamily)
MAVTEKLVRDNVPELDRRRNGTSRFRTAAEGEMGPLLLRKIMEECGELLSAPEEDVPHEAADLIEAVLAYAQHMGHPPELVDHVRRLKMSERGGFGWRQVWIIPY